MDGNVSAHQKHETNGEEAVEPDDRSVSMTRADVLWLIRDLDTGRLVTDHPSRVGCLLE